MAANLLLDVAEHPIVAGLRWILENRRAPDGEPWSMRGLSTAAGLSPSHVERIVAGRTDAARLKLETVERLAEAGQVSSAWLQTGAGNRDAKTEALRYPEREEELALYTDLDPEIRRLVSGMQLHRGVRPSRAIWRGMIEGMLAAKARGEELTAPSVETDEEVPPVRRGR